MSLLTRLDYRRLSGDLEHLDVDVDSALPVALTQLEEYLHRPLESAVRTEIVRLHPDGRAYPLATPIASISDPAQAILRDATYVMGLWPQANPLWDIVYEPYRYPMGSELDRTMPIATITYTGGYSAITLPRKLRQALVDLTRIELSAFVAVTAGTVRRATVGDTSVEYAAPVDRAGAFAGVLDEVRGYQRMELGY